MDPKLAKRRLLKLRRQLVALDEDAADSLAVTLEEESGDEAYDQHPADVGAVTLNREMDLSLQENTERLLVHVNRALEKIEQGTYGICDRGGEPIEEGRLEAAPYATFCMKHQKELERSEEVY